MKRWVIPDDWEEDNGYALVLFCIPNSRRWRGLVTAMVEGLTFGWAWDKKTGSIKDVQAVGREIFRSFCMASCEDIVTELTRIADSLDLQSGIGQHLQYLQVLGIPGQDERIAVSLDRMADQMPTQVTLQELAEELVGDTWLGNFADTAEVLTFIRDTFPFLNLDVKLDATGLILGLLQAYTDRVRFTTVMAQWSQSNIYLATIAAAEAGEDVITTLDTGVDQIWEGLSTITQLLIFAEQWSVDARAFLSDLFDYLFGTDNSPDAILISGKLQTLIDTIEANSNDASALVTAIQELANMQININVDACCDGASGAPPQEGQPVEDDPPADDGGGFPPPFPDQSTYDEYKCRAAHQLRKHLSDTFTAIGNLPALLDGRSFQNGVEIWETVEALKYTFLPNAISYSLTPSALASIVHDISLKYILAWRDQAEDCASGQPSAAVSEERLFEIYRLMAESFADDDLVCDLLEDQNATQAANSIGLAIVRAVDYALDVNKTYVHCNFTAQELTDFTNLLVTNTWLNILFTDSAFTQILVADCSGCGSDPTKGWFYTRGPNDGQKLEPGTHVINSYVDGGDNEISLNSDGPGVFYNITIDSMDPSPGSGEPGVGSYNNRFTTPENPNLHSLEGTSNFGILLCSSSIRMQNSAISFSATFTITDTECVSSP